MKQGTLINRIVMLLLLAAVLVYLGVSAWRSFRDPYTLVLSYAYTVDDSLEATGFLVREESVLASPGGIVDLLPEEGEKVSRGETVALLYQNDSGLARKEELQSLTMEKEQLQYALERTQSGGDSSQLSQQVIDAIVALRSSVSTGDLTRLEDETLLLKSLVYKRDFTFNGGEEDGDAAAAIQSSIDAVDAQIAALSAQAAQDTSRLTAGQAGVFSGQTDGYESLLTPGLLETITPGQLSQLDRQRPQPDAGAVGKLVTDATWYFVCAMGEEEAGRLIEGRTVTVRFSRDWSGEVDMKVERVGETPENGRWPWCCPLTAICLRPPCSESRRWSWSLTVRPASACPRSPCAWRSGPSPTRRRRRKSRSWSPACTSWWASRQNSSPSPSWPNWRISLW